MDGKSVRAADDYEVVRKFSRRLKELRGKNGLTQEKLAEIADISYKNIQYLESQKPTSPASSQSTNSPKPSK